MKCGIICDRKSLFINLHDSCITIGTGFHLLFFLFQDWRLVSVPEFWFGNFRYIPLVFFSIGNTVKRKGIVPCFYRGFVF